jgi:hypothetical protein
LGEHLHLNFSDEFIAGYDTYNFTAITANYSLGLLDQLVTFVYYDWENHDLFRYLSWRRIYDNWSFYTNFFWNSGQSSVLSFQNRNDFFNTGKGLQLLVVYNH